MLIRSLALTLLMCVASVLSVVARPSSRVEGTDRTIQLESMIPSSFAAWKVEPDVIPLQVSPDVQAGLNRIYTQTLARTYVNEAGERVMLSIAYGADQSDSVQVHLPEGCYGGQGFAVGEKSKDILITRFGSIPVAHLEAQKPFRYEPITYWVVIGNEVVTDTWGMKFAKLRYSLKGEIIDGLLVRVSTINIPTQAAYNVHRRFVNDLVVAISENNRYRFIGTTKAPGNLSSVQ